MTSGTYDIITVGGGLGGAALATAMAARGARVLVLEREQQFTDRVRGEAISPWGAVELRALGLYELLLSSCGHEIIWSDLYFDGVQIAHRNMVDTTLQQVPLFTFPHPAMQETLIQAAARGGAEVRRGAHVRQVTPGAASVVTIEQRGQVEEVRARLVVGADGRSSMMRKWGGFQVQRDPEDMLIAGVLFADMVRPHDDAFHWWIDSHRGQISIFFPLGGGRVRAYLGYPQHINPHRLQGEGDLPFFMEESVKAGAPAEFFSGARTIGPLATFSGADAWVTHPYKNGVALIGDAAAACDPTFGQGLSLTVRDVRVLRDHLLSQQDWDSAGHAYAEEHDRYYSVTHQLDTWFRQIFFELGPKADARRARALPLIAQDGARVPDNIISGPEVPADEGVRRRFFGEE